jgi:hypothetical protein
VASPPAQQAPDNVHEVAEVAEVERSLLQTLSWWAACSIIGGGSLWLIGGRTGRPTLRAFGRQTALWGAVNAVIAGAGTALQRAGARQRSAEELRRLLLVNAALDVGYMAGGASLVVARARVGQRPRYSAPQAVGDGTAIIIQGGFIAASDLIHTARLDTRAGSGRDA